MVPLILKMRCFIGKISTLSPKRILIFIGIVCIVTYAMWIFIMHRTGIVSSISSASSASTIPKRSSYIPSEAEFPIAYGLVVYKDFDRTMRLLRAIYRSNNCHCIHVDRKVSKVAYDQLVDSIGQIYGFSSPNVFIVPREESLDVKWGTMSVLDADLLCSQRLLTHCRIEWKYWINLTGHEFPLKTNWEIVTALSLFNGTNLIAASFINRFIERLPMKHKSRLKFTWYYGSTHVAARREFVQFLHQDNRSHEVLRILREWEQKSPLEFTIPDETFYATVNHNPDTIPAPGAFTGVHELNVAALVTRFKLWQSGNSQCGSGQYNRGICMFGLKDLPMLQNSPQLFANKFIPSVEPEAFVLMEEWLQSKVEFENKNGILHPSFDPHYYIRMNISRYHL